MLREPDGQSVGTRETAQAFMAQNRKHNRIKKQNEGAGPRGQLSTDAVHLLGRGRYTKPFAKQRTALAVLRTGMGLIARTKQKGLMYTRRRARIYE